MQQQQAREWRCLLAALPGSYLLDVQLALPLMQSSKHHLSFFREEIGWRFELEEKVTQHLFLRGALNFFSPLEYRLFVSVTYSNGHTLVFRPIVLGRSYLAPGMILREEAGGDGTRAVGCVRIYVELLTANLKRRSVHLQDVTPPDFAQIPHLPCFCYFTHPTSTWLSLKTSRDLLRGIGESVCIDAQSASAAYDDLSAALRDVWCSRT